METNYQLFYRDNGRIEKMQMQAVCADMARKYFELIRPDAEVVHVTNDPLPMTVEYVENLVNTNHLN